MKQILSALICLIFCSTFVAGQPCVAQGDPKITPEERARLVQGLKVSQKEFFAMVEGLSDAQWNYTPSLGVWSVGLVAEHILRTEELLFATAERALASPANPEWAQKTAGKDQFLERALLSRTNRAQAPLEVRPQGKMTRAEIISRFQEIRAKMLKFVETTDLPLKAHTVDHPFPVFGTLNAYQWLAYIPFHTMRHTHQMAKVKANPNFPK
ncbi:MAG TPA: DinB family protein [Blastocatellia bacterium]|nr:DinB family protein [Blastocatellia bacterium]